MAHKHPPSRPLPSADLNLTNNQFSFVGDDVTGADHRQTQTFTFCFRISFHANLTRRRSNEGGSKGLRRKLLEFSIFMVTPSDNWLLRLRRSLSLWPILFVPIGGSPLVPVLTGQSLPASHFRPKNPIRAAYHARHEIKQESHARFGLCPEQIMS